jgi:uncharacterized protein with HEPN domain
LVHPAIDLTKKNDYTGVNYTIVRDVIKNKISELYEQIVGAIENK